MANEPQADQDLAAGLPATSAARARAESIQRLQIGISGLAAMILLVSLASIVINQAREAELGAVQEGSSLTAEDPRPAVQAKDPLAEAGVVPNIPASPAVTPSPGTSADVSSSRP